MKISNEQFKKAIEYILREKKKGKKGKTKFSEEEIQLLKEILKNLPDRAVRHLNYQKIKEECEKVSSKEVSEKLLIRKIVDKIFELEKK